MINDLGAAGAARKLLADHPSSPSRRAGQARPTGDAEKLLERGEHGKEITMEARLNYTDSAVAAKFVKYLTSAGKAVKDSALPAATQHLVETRASQINGCAGCTDMHTERALAGETLVRLDLIAAWRESTVFTEAERAAWNWPSRAPASPTPPAG